MKKTHNVTISIRPLPCEMEGLTLDVLFYLATLKKLKTVVAVTLHSSKVLRVSSRVTPGAVVAVGIGAGAVVAAGFLDRALLHRPRPQWASTRLHR